MSVFACLISIENPSNVDKTSAENKPKVIDEDIDWSKNLNETVDPKKQLSILINYTYASNQISDMYNEIRSDLKYKPNASSNIADFAEEVIG